MSARRTKNLRFLQKRSLSKLTYAYREDILNKEYLGLGRNEVQFKKKWKVLSWSDMMFE